jgi:hypothetical protein
MERGGSSVKKITPYLDRHFVSTILMIHKTSVLALRKKSKLSLITKCAPTSDGDSRSDERCYQAVTSHELRDSGAIYSWALQGKTLHGSGY